MDMGISISDELEKLESGERSRMLDAINAIGNASRGGEDAGAAIKALERALGNEYAPIRVRAAWALSIHFLRKNDIDALRKLSEAEDADIRQGAMQALSLAALMKCDISALMPAIEARMEKEPGAGRNLAGVLSAGYLAGEKWDKAGMLLAYEEKAVRVAAASAYMIAALEGEDIGPLLPSLRSALHDREQEVRHYCAEAITAYHGKRGEWKAIDALLSEKFSDVRFDALRGLQPYAGKFDIGSDLPGVLKSLESNDYELRKEAVTIFRMALEKGQDISFALEALKKAALYGDEEVRQSVANILKANELRKEPGGRCKFCLDCETGTRPGNDSGSFEDLAGIVKMMACCGGEASHRIFRCVRCGKHYISSYYDHTGFEADRIIIMAVAKEDAEAAAGQFRECPQPDKRSCTCHVHTGYMEGDVPPIRGKRVYEETLE